MSSAIELIVDGYAKLKDHQSLEGLRMHRRNLVIDLRARTGFDFRSSIAQIERDKAIEAGLQTLPGPAKRTGTRATHGPSLTIGSRTEVGR